MYQCNNRTACKTDIFEPEPDVDQHTDCRNNHSYDSITSHLTTDRGADICRCDIVLLNTEVVFHCSCQFFTLIQIQCSGLDNDGIAVCNFLCLNICITGYFFYIRYDLLIDLLDRVIFIKCNGCCCTALKLHTEIQWLSVACFVSTHAYKSGYDHCQRNTKEQSSFSKEVDALALFLLTVEFFILEAKSIQCFYQPSGDYQCGKHGEYDTDCQCGSKSFYSTGSTQTKYSCCNQCSNVSVKDCGKCFLKSNVN